MYPVFRIFYFIFFKNHFFNTHIIGSDWLNNGTDNLIKSLIEQFEDEDPQVRLEAAKKLGEVGEEAVDPLVQLLKSDNDQMRKYATVALKSMGSEEVADNLILALKDEDFGVRKFSAKALGELKSSKAVNPLIETLDDEDWGVRLAVMKALGDIGDEAAIDPLKKARRKATGDKDFKKVANKALKKIQKK
jgi:HEAT repeat protein